MKHFIIALNFIALSFAAHVNPVNISPYLDRTAVDKLFDVAIEVQNKLNELQKDVTGETSNLKEEISKILGLTPSIVIQEIELAAKETMQLDLIVRRQVEGRSQPCFQELVSGLNTATNAVGFAASIHIAEYHKEIDDLVKEAIDFINRYNGAFADFFDKVTRSFIGRNMFMSPDSITNRIQELFNEILADWDTNKPDFNQLLDNLQLELPKKVLQLKQKLAEDVDQVKVSYRRIQNFVPYCNEFGDLTPGKFFLTNDLFPKIL